MTKRDYYESLGVERDADEGAIKKAYRALAMKYHPDRNPDPAAVERMKEVNEAYAVLSDPEKRARYDRYGHAGLEGLTQEDIFAGMDFGSLFREFGFGGSGFERFFGGGRTETRRAPQRGADLRLDLEVTLEEVARSPEKTVSLPKAFTCPECHGTGAAPGGLVQCDQCGGTGQIVKERRSGYTLIRQVGMCRRCSGSGRMVKEECPRCKGKGAVEEVKQVTLAVPRGTETGQALRVRGEGEAGEEGGPPGDLYVVFSVKKHPVFERHGDDLIVQKDIGFTDAALGAEITVPGLDGELAVKVPEGTQTGSMFRVPRAGMPRANGSGKGDLYAQVKVVTPTDLNEQAKDLLRQLAETLKPAAAPPPAAGAEHPPEGKKDKKRRWSGKPKG